MTVKRRKTHSTTFSDILLTPPPLPGVGGDRRGGKRAFDVAFHLQPIRLRQCRARTVVLIEDVEPAVADCALNVPKCSFQLRLTRLKLLDALSQSVLVAVQ
jgi:hypothetical protein